MSHFKAHAEQFPLHPDITFFLFVITTATRNNIAIAAITIILAKFIKTLLPHPNGTYDGLNICIDLDELSANPPELLKSTGITLRYTEQIWFCFQGTVSYAAFGV